ncbi:MAG: DoxX family protein [Thermoleophilia bacterium]|nr:DoxX family protein [Thermoleophilia bacterium]
MATTPRTPIAAPVVSKVATASALPAENPATVMSIGALRAMAAMRISLGFVFLWAFLDKAFSLGFSTGRNAETGAIDYFGDGAWINGGSPTEGFLSFGLNTKEPFTSLYSNLAGNAVVDWMFMLGLLGVGAALMLGIGIRIAVVSGIAMMTLMYTAGSIWGANNPVIDDHVIYALALGVIGLAGAGRTWGLGNRWRSLTVVQNHAFLR